MNHFYIYTLYNFLCAHYISSFSEHYVKLSIYVESIQVAALDLSFEGVMSGQS